jgi:hypothetical protein
MFCNCIILSRVQTPYFRLNEDTSKGCTRCSIGPFKLHYPHSNLLAKLLSANHEHEVDLVNKHKLGKLQELNPEVST